MKKSRFTEREIVGILKEADAGLPVGDMIRRHVISTTTHYKWNSNYGGDASELKRIKELEAQLSEFKQIVDDLTLEKQAMKGLMAKKLCRQPEKVKQWSIWLAKKDRRCKGLIGVWVWPERVFTVARLIRPNRIHRWSMYSIRSWSSTAAGALSLVFSG